MLDQHNGMNHQNLYDNLTLSGDVRRLWDHGGNSGVRPAHAAYNTSWNLMLEPDQDIPVHATDLLDGPSAYLIGLTTDAPLMFKYGPDVCTECIGEGTLSVPSLYDYQLDERLSLIITEVADPADNSNGRFVELYNAGTATVYFDNENWFLSRQLKGSGWQDIRLTGSVEPGETYVVSYGSDFTTFNGIYGFNPEMSTVDLAGDGEDGYFLYYAGDHSSGILLDAYGIIDEDGSGKNWEYVDSKAVRRRSVTAPNESWTDEEWVISVADTRDMTPDAWKEDVSWQGNSSVDFNEVGANWNGTHGFVPDASYNVSIPDVSNLPVVTRRSVVNTIIIQAAASVEVNTGVTLTVLE
jgi:hypothetical protein